MDDRRELRRRWSLHSRELSLAAAAVTSVIGCYFYLAPKQRGSGEIIEAMMLLTAMMVLLAKVWDIAETLRRGD